MFFFSIFEIIYYILKGAYQFVAVILQNWPISGKSLGICGPFPFLRDFFPKISNLFVIICLPCFSYLKNFSGLNTKNSKLTLRQCFSELLMRKYLIRPYEWITSKQIITYLGILDTVWENGKNYYSWISMPNQIVAMLTSVWSVIKGTMIIILS